MTNEFFNVQIQKSKRLAYPSFSRQTPRHSSQGQKALIFKALPEDFIMSLGYLAKEMREWADMTSAISSSLKVLLHPTPSLEDFLLIVLKNVILNL